VLAGQLTAPIRLAPLAADRTDAGIEVSGSVPVLFADWGIANPSFPPFVTTQNHGELEFLVRFGKAASG
jgi:hypothetical protein